MSSTPPDPDPTHVPLPPEAPTPSPVFKVPPELVPEAAPEPEAGQSAGAEPEARDWWRWSDVREEWGTVAAEQGRDATEAAREIGQQIGDAVAERLPDPYVNAMTEAHQRLDLRWLRLKLNVPAVLISVLVAWAGSSPLERMTRVVAEDGILAPLGMLLVPVVFWVVLAVTPVGGVFAELLGTMLRGLWRALVRAWGAPYIGYLLHLVAAVAVWSFAIAVVGLVGRAVLNWLTGV